ncbi:MAG: AMP-binding protein, partial [Coleofasciculus sp. S288]|nr:AMP-binding protein [Coleofasciculus sp. S288]
KSNLRFIVLSGELTSCQLYKKLRNLFQDKVRFFNVYGQTETIGNCAYAVPEEFDAEQGYLPVGYPYPHNKAYILDEDLQPVLPGEIGELHMAGGCLARGYLNRPDLNAEKFISNPFVENITSESFDQLFKTGDLARYLPDGAIELLTRVDFQVKLRGMRVELGEIESALEQYSGIKQAVVVAREDIPGEKRLVAYAVPEFHSEEIISNVLSRELRRFLEQKLPDYMVPSAFVFLDTLPLTPNGKLDRLSLPAPIQDNSDPNRAFAAPQDDLELQLTQIWEKLLGVQSIGIKDDFFELGGNSLLAVQLVTEIQKISGTNLPLTALLEASTVEQMANILRQPIQTDWPVLVPIRSTGSKKPLFCIHAIGGPVLFYRDLVRYLDPEQPLYGLQSKGLDGKQTPLTRVEDMAALYIKEMRTVQPEGPYFIGGHSFGGLIAYEMAQQLHAQGQKVALLAFFDVITPKLAKTSPPLLRFVRTHLINFWRTETKDKLNYFMKRVKWYQLRKEVRKNEYKEHLQKQKVNAIPMLHVLDTNYQASMSYEPKTYPGKVTVFRAMEQSPRSAHDPYMGWGELATGGVESYEIPGSHLNIVEEPNVKFLAEKLSVCLNKAQANYVYLVQQ